MTQVRTLGIGESEGGAKEREKIQKTYAFALNRFVHIIREVEIWCTDNYGPRVGIDKTCRVQLW